MHSVSARVQTDNGTRVPIEAWSRSTTGARREVLEVVDYGIVPLPPERGSYLPEDVGPMRDDLKGPRDHQPEGPSFRRRRQSCRVAALVVPHGFDPYEGLTLHDIDYRDGDRQRRVLTRASIRRCRFPTATPVRCMDGRTRFDAGEWGLGRMANNLTLGCDCLGVIHYFDAVLATEEGEPYTVEHAICMHEEDHGILWKHNDMHEAEPRYAAPAVSSSASSRRSANYEYGFYWYFYLDGNIALRGEAHRHRLDDGRRARNDLSFGNLIARVSPHHITTLFSARLDLDVMVRRTRSSRSRPSASPQALTTRGATRSAKTSPCSKAAGGAARRGRGKPAARGRS